MGQRNVRRELWLSYTARKKKEKKINGVVKGRHFNPLIITFSNNKKYINCLYRYSPVGDPNALGHIHVHNRYHLN